ncbi:MAG TPA: hypothetical protein VGX48_01540 [Pyrinomonadaceae bacterium]|jgi:hypothetical protein|nr:hypothetical protein [Pyrinomonadaceae bacterium]
MGDWLGLGLFVLVVVGALVGLSYLGRAPKKLTEEEYRQRVAESRGTMSAGVAGVMYALQKLMNPKAAEAVEVMKDLKAGFYDDEEKDAGPDEAGSPKLRAGLTDKEGDDA